MKHSRFLLLTLLLVIAALLCSCDLLAQYVPGLVPATTTNEVTTMTTTESTPSSTTAPAAVTTAPVTTVTTAVTTVTTAPRVTVNERTPAGTAVNLFDGNLATYAVGYETGAESAASTLATALGKTAAAYDASVAASLHLAIKTDGIVPLASARYPSCDSETALSYEKEIEKGNRIRPGRWYYFETMTGMDHFDFCGTKDYPMGFEEFYFGMVNTANSR